MTLEQILFSQGFGARKLCRLLIVRGDVEIGGITCVDPASEWNVASVGDVPFVFCVLGISWQYHAKAYLMLHKLADYECSQKPTSHKSVYALLPSPLRARDVQAVGRLDQDTTGMLLFSDDGQFIHRMTSPKHEVPKVYDVIASEDVTPAQIARLLAGVVLDDSPTPVHALACAQSAPREIQLTLTSGKYHQAKRMLAAVGNHVEHLHRRKIGQLTMPIDMAAGDWRWLTPDEWLMVSMH